MASFNSHDPSADSGSYHVPTASQRPPPLPSRSSYNQFPSSSAPPPPPPPYSPYLTPPGAGSFKDPRSASTQSLVPDYSSQHERRRLLIVYIHGYRGTEASFRSLPAHVHELVSMALAESHIVHTKVYPRYYTKGELRSLAEEFSRWLAPHESPTTDVILCGHSLGGLMCAEVVLLPRYPPGPDGIFRHRILGTISFDAPFLGLHPHVVKTGLQSLFAKYEDEEATAPPPTEGGSGAGANSPGAGNMLSAMLTDPNYNPVYANDARLPQPRDMFKDILHFIGKHSDDVIEQSKQAIKTHWAYHRSIVTDISGMKFRYTRIRALEEEDERRRLVATDGRPPAPRVRFVNYYNACTSPERKRSKSRHKSPLRTKPNSSPGNDDRRPGSRGRSTERRSETPQPAVTPSKSPRISIEEHKGSEVIKKDLASSDSVETPPFSQPSSSSALGSMSQMSLLSSEQSSIFSNSTPASLATFDTAYSSDLPPIPPMPEEPTFVDPSQYPNKDALKLAQKDQARALKAYKQAIKDRNSAIKDRQKYEEKLRKEAKKAEQARQKAERREQKGKAPANNMTQLEASLAAASFTTDPSAPPSDDEDDEAPTIAPSTAPESDELTVLAPRPMTPSAISEAGRDSPRALPDTQPSLPPTQPDDGSSSPTQSQSVDELAAVSSPERPPKKKKTKKFCILPSHINGVHDPTWIRILMEKTNPPAAHTAMFVPTSKTYEHLVGDVAGRIEEWVGEDNSRRLVELLERGNY